MSEKTYKLQDLIDKYPDEMAKVMACPNVRMVLSSNTSFPCLNDVLLSAFNWEGSPQGWDYWNNISYLLNDLIPKKGV